MLSSVTTATIRLENTPTAEITREHLEEKGMQKMANDLYGFGNMFYIYFSPDGPRAMAPIGFLSPKIDKAAVFFGEHSRVYTIQGTNLSDDLTLYFFPQDESDLFPRSYILGDEQNPTSDYHGVMITPANPYWDDMDLPLKMHDCLISQGLKIMDGCADPSRKTLYAGNIRLTSRASNETIPVIVGLRARFDEDEKLHFHVVQEVLVPLSHVGQKALKLDRIDTIEQNGPEVRIKFANGEKFEQKHIPVNSDRVLSTQR